MSDELIEWASKRATELKREDGNWEDCDLIRELRNRLQIAEARAISAEQELEAMFDYCIDEIRESGRVWAIVCNQTDMYWPSSKDFEIARRFVVR